MPRQRRRTPTVCHAIVTTHTDRHLGRVLHALARQTKPVQSVVVTCDTDSDTIADVVRKASATHNLDITLVRRPHQGQSRSAQVRNNGVRALQKRSLQDDSLLLFLDGDIVLTPDAVARHLQLAQKADVIVGFRYDLTDEQTGLFNDNALDLAQLPVEPEPEQIAAIAARDARYKRQLIMRKLRLAKPHKPKLLSAHFSVTASAYAAVNGFDEAFVNYGQEDDDLGRRLYRWGAKPAVAVAAIHAFHLYHTTRAPEKFEDQPNAATLKQKRFKVRCEKGLENHAEQPKPKLGRFLNGQPADPTEPVYSRSTSAPPTPGPPPAPSPVARR